MEEQAQAAYEAMRADVHGVSPISGLTLPPWEELDAAVKAAWVQAIQTTEDAIAPEAPPPP